jgi:hypothetical protein
MYMQRTTSSAAGNGLYKTIKYMRGASGIGMGTTIKHCDAQRKAPQETARCNDEVPAMHNERRREQRHEHHHHPPL